jgi:hypothetical protein
MDIVRYMDYALEEEYEATPTMLVLMLEMMVTIHEIKQLGLSPSQLQKIEESDVFKRILQTIIDRYRQALRMKIDQHAVELMDITIDLLENNPEDYFTGYVYSPLLDYIRAHEQQYKDEVAEYEGKEYDEGELIAIETSVLKDMLEFNRDDPSYILDNPTLYKIFLKAYSELEFEHWDRIFNLMSDIEYNIRINKPSIGEDSYFTLYRRLEEMIRTTEHHHGPVTDEEIIGRRFDKERFFELLSNYPIEGDERAKMAWRRKIDKVLKIE